MVILEIHSKPLKNKYKCRLFSKATVFICIANFVAVVVPFIFAYRSRGFWLKHDTFYEQPNVKFKGEYLFVGITNNINNPIVCNNFPYYQDHSNFDTCDKVKVREIDDNFDGKVDEFFTHLHINLPADTKILFFNLILPLDYTMHTVCPMQMQTAIILQKSLVHPTTHLDITGNLVLSQTYPLFCHLKGRDANYNYSVIEDEENLEDYKIDKILEKYLRRNLTTHLKNIYTTYGTDGSEKLLINLRVRYPVQKMYYKPGFWQIIKYAWVQYLAIYIVFAWIVKKVKNYVFDNSLILYYEYSPIKKDS